MSFVKHGGGFVMDHTTIFEVVWDHRDREQNKSQPTSKEEL